MLEFGPAIGYIRSFCYGRLGILIDDEDVCSSGERIRNVATNLKEVELDFNLLPNPANSIIRIQPINFENQSFTTTIQNMQGATLLTKIVDLKNPYIYIDELPSGVYVVNLRCTNGSKSKKLIIVK